MSEFVFFSPFLSVSVCFWPFLSLSDPFVPFLSVSVSFCLFLPGSFCFCQFLSVSVNISVPSCHKYYCICPKYDWICPKYDWSSPIYDWNCYKYVWIWFLFQPYGSGTSRSTGRFSFCISFLCITVSPDHLITKKYFLTSVLYFLLIFQPASLYSILSINIFSHGDIVLIRAKA